jgi:hypothetical protein
MAGDQIVKIYYCKATGKAADSHFEGSKEISIHEFNEIKRAKDLPFTEHRWVRSELIECDRQLSLHHTEDKRSIGDIEDWKRYARELRDYTSERDGIFYINSESRPIRPLPNTQFLPA